MIPELDRLMDHLCARADPARLAASDARFQRALRWESVDRLPVVSAGPLPVGFPFAPFPFHEMFGSAEKMLHNELVHAFDLSIAASHRFEDDLPWTVRANFGTVLIASAFGARVEQRDENPPWVLHEENAPDPAALANSEFDLDAGWLPRARDTMARYREILAGRPPLDRLVRVTLPDLQGPFDNYLHIRGHDAFLDLLDAPDAAARALRRVADAQIEAARSFLPLTSDGPDGFCHQHGFMVRGRILLRCDSVLMLEPALYRDAIAPHDNRVLEAMDGGGIHSCGDITRLAPEILRLPALECIDLGQSELNDRDLLYRLAAPRRIALIRVHATEDELRSDAFRARFPTGIAVKTNRMVN